MAERGLVHVLLLLLTALLLTTGTTTTMTEARRSAKLQPTSALGHNTHKARQIDDKHNIIVADDDDDDADVDVDDLYRISVENKARPPPAQTWYGERANSRPSSTSPTRYDHGRDKLVALVTSLSERLAALQHTLGNIKLQNHYIYRTIKKGYRSCKDSANESTIKVAAQKIEKPKCPLGYVINPDTNMCYKLAAERITWRMARERCRMEDADLVTIETKLEQRWINQLARQSPDTRHCDFWTGATDKYAEGDWRWIANNNALSYSNWNHNEPNNGRGDEHCMQMLWVFNWAWNDARCNYNNACYICEMPLSRY